MAETAAGDHGEDCRSCPACVQLGVVRGVRPQVLVHLTAVGHGLLRAHDAALAAVDATADEQVWGDEQRGRSPDMPLPADEQPRSMPAGPLRHIRVE